MNTYWRLGMWLLAIAISAQAQPLHKVASAKQALEVLPRASVTVLVDNMAGGGSVLGEWGVAFFVETDGHRLLFDTGGGAGPPRECSRPGRESERNGGHRDQPRA